MDKVKRLEKLELFFQLVGGEIAGKKKLHKLIYLSQGLGFDFGQDFIFHYYGVYSPSLSKDIELAQTWGIIQEYGTKKDFGVEYHYKLVEEEPQKTYGHNENTNYKITLLSQQPAVVLEVLSTIIFLDRKGYSGAELCDKLGDLKGHLKHCFDKAFQLAKDIFRLDCVN